MIGKSEKYLLELFLASVEKDYYPSNDISDVNFERIYKISSISRVANCIYYGLLKLDPETLAKVPNLEDFKKECLVYGIKEKIQETEIVDIISAFEKEKINILFFKGYVLRYIYPSVDMRVMGDIDFLVEPKELDKAQKVLKEIGFKKDEKVDYNVEVGYTRNIEVELHKKLSVNEIKYFDNAWDYKEKFLEYPNTYKLETNYHFIYLVSHVLHHIVKGGLGLKYPMDFYLYLKNYDVDLMKIKKDLEKTKLDKLTKLIILLCHKWFNLPLDKYQDFIGDFEVDDKIMETFEVFILSGGEYGINRNIYTVQRATQRNKFKYLLSKVFRPVRFVLKTDNPKWWQYILVPFYYLKYWFKFLIISGKNNLKKAKAYINEDEDISDLEKLFKKIDI